MAFNGSGAPLTSLNASNLGSGTVPTARMPTYVSTVNGQSGAVTVTVDTTSVLNATAGATAGAVGSYAFLGDETASIDTNFNATRAGSALRPISVGKQAFAFGGSIATLRGAQHNSGTQAGTWKCMGQSLSFFLTDDNHFPGTLWLRIS